MIWAAAGLTRCACSVIDGGAHGDGNSDVDANSDGDGNSDGNRDGNSDGNRDGNGNRDGSSDGDGANLAHEISVTATRRGVGYGDSDGVVNANGVGILDFVVDLVCQRHADSHAHRTALRVR